MQSFKLSESHQSATSLRDPPATGEKASIARLLGGSERGEPRAYNPLQEGEARRETGSPVPRSLSQLSQASSRLQSEDLKKLYELQLSLLRNPQLLGATPPAAAPAAVAELQKALKEAQGDAERLRKQVNDLEFAAAAREQRAEAEAARAESLAAELGALEDCRAQLEQALFDAQRLEAERDFHLKNHAELRRLLSARAATDFAVAQLKREVFFKLDEAEQLRRRNAELEESVSELLVFAERPRGEKEQSPEGFFARRIVELEAAVKRLQEEKQELEGWRVLRRGEAGSSGADAERLKTAQAGAEALRVENARLQKELLAAARRDFHPAALGAQLEQLARLKEENARLRQGVESGEGLAALAREKGQLQLRVDELQLQLSQKNQELLRQTALGKGEPPVGALAETNRRLNAEISRLQEQLRKVEEMGRGASAH